VEHGVMGVGWCPKAGSRNSACFYDGIVCVCVCVCVRERERERGQPVWRCHQTEHSCVAGAGPTDRRSPRPPGQCWAPGTVHASTKCISEK